MWENKLLQQSKDVGFRLFAQLGFSNKVLTVYMWKVGGLT